MKKLIKTRDKKPSLVARADGFGWRFFALYLLITCIDLLFGFGRRNLEYPETVFQVLFFSFTGTLVSWVLLCFLKKLYLSREFSKRHPSVMVITVLITVLVSSLEATIVSLMTFSADPLFSAFLSLDQVLFQTLVILILNSSFARWLDFKGAVRELEITRRNLTILELEGNQALNTERQAIIQETSRQVTEVLNKFDSQNPQEFSDRLALTADQIIRPMSHTLMRNNAELNLPQPKANYVKDLFLALSSISIKSNLKSLWVAAICTFYFMRVGTIQSTAVPVESPGEITVAADFSSIGMFLAEASAVFIVFLVLPSLANSILRGLLPRLRHVHWRWFWQITFASAVALLGSLLLQQLFALLAGFSDIPLASFGIGDFALPVFLAAALHFGFELSNTRNRLQIQELDGQRKKLGFDVARLNEQLLRERKALAKALHGEVRAALIAGSLQLRQSASSPDDLNDLVKTIRVNVSQALANLEASSTKDLDFDGELALISKTWGGVCDFSIVISSDARNMIEKDRNCQPALVEIIGEACSNAVIHGKAKELQIQIDFDGEQLLVVEIQDDGKSAFQETEPGIGDEIFNQVSVFWSRTRNQTGTKVIAHIPVLFENPRL